MQKSHVDIIMSLFCPNENHCGKKKYKIKKKKKKNNNKKKRKKRKKNRDCKNNIAIRIVGKVSRYIDASMNRATPSSTSTVINGNKTSLKSFFSLASLHTMSMWLLQKAVLIFN